MASPNADDEDYVRELGQRIREARIAAGWKSAQAFHRHLIQTRGHLTGLGDYDAYSKAERGEKQLSDARTLAALASELRVSMHWLVTGESEASEALEEWLARVGDGKVGDDEGMRQWLRMLPVPAGLEVDDVFWDLACLAYGRLHDAIERAAALEDSARKRQRKDSGVTPRPITPAGKSNKRK